MSLATRCVLPLALALALAAPTAEAASFVHEGRLDDRGQPANGRYDLTLSADGAAARGTTLAVPTAFASDAPSHDAVEAERRPLASSADGRFAIDLRFGGAR
jgi:hypothetical protein